MDKEKKELAPELQEIIDKVNNPPDEYPVNNLLGLHGNPRFARGQQFDLQSDEDGVFVKLEIEKVKGANNLLLKSMRKLPDNFLVEEKKEDKIKYQEEVGLLSLNEKFVKFKVIDVQPKKVVLIGKTFKNVELPEGELDVDQTASDNAS